MRAKVPAPRVKRRAAKVVVDPWCPWAPRPRGHMVSKPGVQRCPECGKRVRAYPGFDDGGGSQGSCWREAPGTGAETVLAEMVLSSRRRHSVSRAELRKHAASYWFIGPHKRKGS